MVSCFLNKNLVMDDPWLEDVKIVFFKESPTWESVPQSGILGKIWVDSPYIWYTEAMGSSWHCESDICLSCKDELVVVKNGVHLNICHGIRDQVAKDLQCWGKRLKSGFFHHEIKTCFIKQQLASSACWQSLWLWVWSSLSGPY